MTGGIAEQVRGVDLRPHLMLAVVVLVWVGFQLQTDGLFLSGRNLSNLAIQASTTGVLAVGMTYILIAREIDLSVGAAVALVGTFVAWLQVDHGMATGLAILIGLGAGIVAGIAQGAIVAFIGVPSFIVTLGGMLVYRGLEYVVSGSKTIAPLHESLNKITGSYFSTGIALTVIIAVAVLVVGLSIWRSRHDTASVLARLVRLTPVLFALALIGWITASYRGFPSAVLILVLCACAGGAVLAVTTVGRRVYIFGGNRETARYAGLSGPKMIFGLFALMGLLYGVAGVMTISRLGGAAPGQGMGLELDVISACIIGGTSLFGGRGTVMGSLIGVFLFQSLANGMDLAGIASEVQLVVRGLILVVAVSLDVLVRKGSSRET